MKKVLVVIVVVVIVALLSIRVITARLHPPEVPSVKGDILGMGVRDIWEGEYITLKTDKGVLIYVVYANSVAEQKGLRRGDVVVAINDQPVEHQGDYYRILDKALMQDSMTLHIKRESRDVYIRITAEYAAAYNNLGNAYVRDKQYDKAIEAYQKAISIDMRFAEAYYNLGSVYQKQGKHDLAAEHFRKALEHGKDLTDAYYKLTDVYSQQGKSEDAINAYKEMFTHSPSDTITSGLKPVEVIHATQGEIKDQLRTSGTIEPRAVVTVFPKVPGVIEQMKVDEGDTVQRDQVLAVVEHEELELQLQQAEAALEAAQAAYDQAVQLAEVRTKSQVTQTRAGLEAAEAALEQVRDLAETRTETQIQQAKAALDALRANKEKIRRGAREEEREQIKATVAQAEANLTNTQSNYERMDKLFEEGAISKQTYEGAQTQLDVAKAQYRAAQQQWKMVEEGAREEDIQAMDAQVKQAEAAFKLAQKQAEKQTWQKDIAMAEAQAEQARAALESAEMLLKARSWEAEITIAKTQLTQARVARDMARKRLADAFVKSPIHGIVSVRDVDEGNMANPSVPLFEIMDMDVIHADVDVMEFDLGKIRLKDIAWVGVSALDAPLQGHVTSISPKVDEVSRTAQVEITVENPGHLLRPGMFAQVSIPTDVRPDAVLLPRSAVIEDPINGETYVFVVDSGRSRRRPVEYGLREGNLVEIAKGLEAGTPIVISGQQKLGDGDFVQVIRVIEEL